MPRRGRVYQRALCYHVMNRGVNRNAIFTDDTDRLHFMKTAAKYKKLCSAKVYHWVLMGNHYHMLVEVAHKNLRPFVGGLQQAYAQYHHKRHEGTGVFWQGRFRSKPVEVGPYIGHCGRYIERNPVRAGLIRIAWEYHWSSAAAYVLKVPDGLTDETSYLGTLSDQARIQYGAVLMSGIDDEVMKLISRSTIGSVSFQSRLKTARGRHRRKRGRPAQWAPVTQ